MKTPAISTVLFIALAGLMNAQAEELKANTSAEKAPVIKSNAATACFGQGVAASIVAGNGDNGYSETYQWRQDEGAWQTYTNETIVGTAAKSTIEIIATRNCSSCTEKTVLRRWTVQEPVNKTFAYSMTPCTDDNGFIAQLTAPETTANTGVWIKTDGPGTVFMPMSNIASVNGITPGATTKMIRLSISPTGCSDTSSFSITAPKINSVSVSKFDKHFTLSCPIRNGATLGYYDSQGKIVMKVTDIPGGNSLGNAYICADLSYKVSGNPSDFDVPILAGQDQPFLPRSWAVNPDNFKAAYRVYLYFTDEELTALTEKAEGTNYEFGDISKLVVTGYPNVNSTYTKYAPTGGKNYTPTFTREGNHWIAVVTATGANTFYIHPLKYPMTSLPMESTSFNALPMDEFIRLNWETSNELNSDHFDVERSIDGKAFTKIGTVKGSGTVDFGDAYLFDDHSAEVNKNYYYRLKEVSFDQAYRSSSVVMASIKKSDKFKVGEVTPNPASGLTSILVTSLDNASMKMTILGMDGKVAKEESYRLNAGVNQINFNADKLIDGTYLCRFEIPDGIVTKKLIKSK